MKTLTIDWLGSCEHCGSDAPKKVTTEKGTEDWLWDGDVVSCMDCNNVGEIVCYGDIASVSWGEEEK